MSFSKCKCYNKNSLISFLIQIGDTQPFAHSDIEHVKAILNSEFSVGVSRISGFLIKGEEKQKAKLNDEEKEIFKNLLKELGYEEFLVQNFKITDEFIVGEGVYDIVDGEVFYLEGSKGVIFESL